MILLDTDVASFIFRGDSRGEAYFELVKGQPLSVSFMSAAELFAWAELNHWGERRRAELDWLLAERYAVLGFEMGLAREWGESRLRVRRRVGRSRHKTGGWRPPLDTSTYLY